MYHDHKKYSTSIHVYKVTGEFYWYVYYNFITEELNRDELFDLELLQT